MRPRPSVDMELELFAAVTMAMLEEERVDRTVIESVLGDDLCIRHLDETRAWQDFCLRRGDLPRQFAALRFPALWRCKNGSTFPPASLMPHRRFEKSHQKTIR